MFRSLGRFADIPSKSQNYITEMWIKSQNWGESESDYETNLEKLKQTDRTTRSGLVQIALPKRQYNLGGLNLNDNFL